MSDKLSIGDKAIIKYEGQNVQVTVTSVNCSPLNPNFVSHYVVEFKNISIPVLAKEIVAKVSHNNNIITLDINKSHTSLAAPIISRPYNWSKRKHNKTQSKTGKKVPLSPAEMAEQRRQYNNQVKRTFKLNKGE